MIPEIFFTAAVLVAIVLVKLGAWCVTKCGMEVGITYEYNAQFKQNNLKSALEIRDDAPTPVTADDLPF